MERKQLTLVVLLVVVVAGTLWVRSYFSPAQVVRRQFLEAVASFENGKILGVMSKISRSYTDRWGGDFESLGGSIQSVIESCTDLEVDLVIGEVEVHDDEIRLGVEFDVSGRVDGSRGAVLGSSVDPCRATLLWTKEQSGWRLKEIEELDIPEYRERLEKRRTR